VVLVSLMVPAGSSMTQADLKTRGEMRKGLKSDMALITLFSSSTNKTSMGKAINQVCTDLQGLMINASPPL